MNVKALVVITAIILFCLLWACHSNNKNIDDIQIKPTPYILNIPAGMPRMYIPADNPLTVEGVRLGRKLFYDPILSGNNKMSCATCHRMNYYFADSAMALSTGVDGQQSNRTTMSLFNVGFGSKFFWDGGAATLESQVIGPLADPVEMHSKLIDVVNKLKKQPEYPTLFQKAFPGQPLSMALLMRAIAQFERTLISADSKYDKWKRGDKNVMLTKQEQRGMQLYMNPMKGNCIHCHTMGGTFTDYTYRDIGLDKVPVDKGRGRITLDSADDGKFKTPSLRNVAVTAPYMHDGRFKTLQQVLDFYNTGFQYSRNLDPAMRHAVKGRLSQQDIQDIIAFLLILTDESCIHDTAYGRL